MYLVLSSSSRGAPVSRCLHFDHPTISLQRTRRKNPLTRRYCVLCSLTSARPPPAKSHWQEKQGTILQSSARTWCSTVVHGRHQAKKRNGGSPLYMDLIRVPDREDFYPHTKTRNPTYIHHKLAKDRPLFRVSSADDASWNTSYLGYNLPSPTSPRSRQRQHCPPLPTLLSFLTNNTSTPNR